MAGRAHRTLAVDTYPEPKVGETIVQIIAAKGNNLYDVRFPDSSTCICCMPSRFRHTIWIKRNDFAIVEPVSDGGGVHVQIVNILLADQIRHLHKRNLWPDTFKWKKNVPKLAPASEAEAVAAASDSEFDSEDDSDLLPNMNRRGGLQDGSDETGGSENSDSD